MFLRALKRLKTPVLETVLLSVSCQALEGDTECVSVRVMKVNSVYSLGVISGLQLFLNSFVRFPLLVINLVWCVCARVKLWSLAGICGRFGSINGS